MAVTQSARLGLTLWSSGADPLTRAQLLGDHQAIDNLAAIDVQGATVGDRPAAGVRGRYFTALDTGSTFRDNGTTWTPVGMSLSSAAPAALPFDSGGAAGTSLMASRADHVHPTPAHDAAAHSAIKLSDLAAPTAAVAFGSQRITNLAAPAAATDAATKGYVDGLIPASGVAWTYTNLPAVSTTGAHVDVYDFRAALGNPSYAVVELEAGLIFSAGSTGSTNFGTRVTGGPVVPRLLQLGSSSLIQSVATLNVNIVDVLQYARVAGFFTVQGTTSQFTLSLSGGTLSLSGHSWIRWRRLA